MHEKSPTHLIQIPLGGLPFWSFWKHELPRVTSFMVSWTPWNSLTFLRYPTKTRQFQTEKGPFQWFRLSDQPVLMMFKWFLWLQNRGTFSLILLPDVYIVYGSLEWFIETSLYLGGCWLVTPPRKKADWRMWRREPASCEGESILSIPWSFFPFEW